MLKRTTIFSNGLILFLTAAQPASSETLREGLNDYVVAFDLSEVTASGREKLQRLISRDDLSHADKVLAAHAILSKEDALFHVDMHRNALTVSAQAD